MKRKTGAAADEAADSTDTTTADDTAAAAPASGPMVRVTNARKGTWRIELDATTKIEIGPGESTLVTAEVWERALALSTVRDSLTSRQLACANVDGLA